MRCEPVSYFQGTFRKNDWVLQELPLAVHGHLLMNVHHPYILFSIIKESDIYLKDGHVNIYLCY